MGGIAPLKIVPIEVLVILTGLIGMLVSGRVRTDLAAMIALGALLVLRILPFRRLLAGFGSEPVILIGSMMVVAEAFRRTGLMDGVLHALSRSARRSPTRLRQGLLLAAALTAPFLETTAAVTLYLPLAADLNRSAQRERGLFMVVATGALSGAMISILGTSSNVIGNGSLLAAGLKPLPLFGLLPLGLALVALALVYITSLGAWLLPRGPGPVGPVERSGGFVSELEVLEGSELVGAALADTQVFGDFGITVLSRLRRGRWISPPPPRDPIQPGDRLLVSARGNDLLRLGAMPGIKVLGEMDPSAQAEADGQKLAELLLPPGSPWTGYTLAQLAFRPRYQVSVVGLWRHGEPVTERLAHLPLQSGDILLVRGAMPLLARLQDQRLGVLLTEVEATGARRSRKLWVLVAMSVFMLLAFTGYMALGPAAFVAALLCILTGCVTPEEAYAAIEWSLLFLIAGLLPLGQAMTGVGLTASTSAYLAHLLRPLGPEALLAGIAVLGALSTQILSNVPTAVLLSPAVIVLAQRLHANPYACVVTLLASVMVAPATVQASKPTLLVAGAGGYQNRDYLRYGLPFAVLALTVTLLVVPVFWPVGPLR